MRNENGEIDPVQAGLGLMIFGYLIMLFAVQIADFHSSEPVTVIYDKYSLIPTTVHPGWFRVLGFLWVLVGGAIFLRNLLYLAADNLRLKLRGVQDQRHY